MNVDMSNFQPLTRLNQFSKGNVNTANSAMANNENHIDKSAVASNIVNNKLSEVLGVPENKQSKQFDFESVGKNILGFVKNGLQHAQQKGASTDKLEGLLADAQRGIKEGLASASKELQQAGLLSDDIKQGITDTQGYLTAGLKTLSEEMINGHSAVASPSSSYREASHYNLTKDASFSFTTKEGDQVNIIFNSEYLQQNVDIINQSQQGFSSASSQKIAYQDAFSLQVNGELNEQEQQAINELMGSLQTVSDLFFEGNIDDAFEQAQSISMDPTHLAAFSMDLQRTETIVSIKEYQQLMPGKEIATQLTPINDELATAYEHAKPFAIEEHLTELLGWLIPEDQSGDELLQYSQAIFDKLQLLDTASNAVTDEPL